MFVIIDKKTNETLKNANNYPFMFMDKSDARFFLDTRLELYLGKTFEIKTYGEINE